MANKLPGESRVDQNMISALDGFFGNRPLFELAGFAFTVWGALSAVKATISLLFRNILPAPRDKSRRNIKRLTKNWNSAVAWQRRISSHRNLIIPSFLVINLLFLGSLLIWVILGVERSPIIRTVAFGTMGLTFLSAGVLATILDGALNVESLRNKYSAEIIRIALYSNVMSTKLREAALDRDVPQAIMALKELLQDDDSPMIPVQDGQELVSLPPILDNNFSSGQAPGPRN